jgi:hypothetical protein
MPWRSINKSMKIVVFSYLNFTLSFFRNITNNSISCLWFDSYIILLLLFISLPLLSDDKIKWSTYQGKKTYQEAKDHCQNLKMRLPTLDDLSRGPHKDWKKNGNRFWAVNEDQDRPAYIHYYFVYNISKYYKEVHKPESEIGVYCANVTKESIELDKIREQNEKLLLGGYITTASNMNYKNSKKFCEDREMRLPTIEELMDAYKLGRIVKSDYSYWSSTWSSGGDLRVLNAKYGMSDFLYWDNDIGKDRTEINAICHR